LAVQWLNEALCPENRDFVVADSLVLRNRQLLVAANRWWQYYRDAIIDRTFPALHGLLPAALVSFDQAHSGA